MEHRTENDIRIEQNVQEYGCHVYSIFDPEENEPNFSYSIGIQKSTGAPEVIVIGLGPKLGNFIVNEYNRQVRSGTRFESGILYSGFIEGFSIYVEPAKADLLKDYMLGCNRYYKNEEYSAVQIIWPSTGGVWPWEPSASEWFKTNQPMLGRARPDNA